MQFPLAPSKIGAGMFVAESYTSRHHIAIVAMACLCVLLGGPTYAAGAESLIIAGATYCEPGVSDPGWAWADADHLELDGYAGDAIGADGDLVVTLAGQNSVTESQAPDADIAQCGMEVWGSLTLRGTGSLAASGSQCAVHVSRALLVDGSLPPSHIPHSGRRPLVKPGVKEYAVELVKPFARHIIVETHDTTASLLYRFRLIEALQNLASGFSGAVAGFDRKGVSLDYVNARRARPQQAHPPARRGRQRMRPPRQRRSSSCVRANLNTTNWPISH